MAERRYTYILDIDDRALADLERRVSAALSSAGQATTRAAPPPVVRQQVEAIEQDFKQIQGIDLTKPADELKTALAQLQDQIQELDREIQSAYVSGGTVSRDRMAELDEYYDKLARTQGEEAAALARGRGVVGSIGDERAEFAGDIIPAEEFTRRAYGEVKEIRKLSAEQEAANLEAQRQYYQSQIQASQIEQEILRRQIAEGQEFVQTFQPESAEQAELWANVTQAVADSQDELERLLETEADAARSLEAVLTQQRQAVEAEQEAQRRQALRAGDISAATTAGPASRLTVSVTKATAANAQQLADQLERAAKLEERITGQVKEQQQQLRQRLAAEERAVRLKQQEQRTTDQLAEVERRATIEAERAARVQTEAARAEARRTQVAITEARERERLARAEAQERIEQARAARIRIQEEERRITATHRDELRSRQRAAAAATTTGAGAGLGAAGVGLARGALGAVGIYGGYEAVQAGARAGRRGAFDLRTMETFRNLAAQIGIDATEMADRVQAASNRTIDSVQAIQLASQIVAQRFSKDADDLVGDTEILIRASRRLAQVYADESGQLLSTEEVFARLIKFVREGNKELVDQFGISNQLIADTLGVANEGLRGSEGAILRWRGMVEILSEELERLGEAHNSLADDIEGNEARIRDAQRAIGIALSGPYADVLEIIANVVGGVHDATSSAEEYAQALYELTDANAELSPEAQAYAERVRELQNAFRNGQLSLADFNAEMERTVGAYQGYRAEAEQAEIATRNMTGAVDELTDAQRELQRLGGIPSIYRGRAELYEEGRLTGRIAPGFGGQGDPYEDIDAAYDALETYVDDVNQRNEELAEQEARNIERIQNLFERAIDSQEKEQIRAAKRFASEAERAARQAAQAFESALGGVPGLFGTSDVTAEQMELAELGISQDFADNYLRRLTDEVMNGVQWDDVDIGDAARRAGIDPNLPAEAILGMFRQAWEGGRLFAGGQNLDLINLDAVRAALEQQQADEAGRQAIIDYLAGEGLGEAYGVFGQRIADGIERGLPAALDERDIATPALAKLQNQFTTEEAVATFTNVGFTSMESFLQGMHNAANESPHVAAATAALLGRILAIMQGDLFSEEPSE